MWQLGDRSDMIARTSPDIPCSIPSLFGLECRGEGPIRDVGDGRLVAYHAHRKLDGKVAR